MRPPITVIVPCKNEESQIAACLNSVWGWAEEILVADNGSTDQTRSIVAQYCHQSPQRCRLIEREFVGYGDFKNWAISQSRHEWVLCLDADERLTSDIRDEIDRVLRSDSPFVAYRVRFRPYFLGREIRHCGWTRDKPIRLMRKSLCRYDDCQVHEGVIVERGKVGTLQFRIEHRTYRSLNHWMWKKNRYTTLGAQQLASCGKKARPVRDLLLRPLLRFIRTYFFYGGILDGIPGLVISMDDAFGTFLKYAKLWELEHVAPPGPISLVERSNDVPPAIARAAS